MTKHGSKDLNKQTGGGKMEKLKQIWKDIVFELFVGLAVWYIVGISDPIKRLKGIRNNHNWDTVNLFILQILVFVTIIGSIIIFFVKGYGILAALASGIVLYMFFTLPQVIILLLVRAKIIFLKRDH